MRALIRLLFLIAAVLAIIFYSDFTTKDDILFNQSTIPLVDESIKDEPNILGDVVIDTTDEGLATLMGENSSTVREVLGEPTRIDPSPYGYDWWIYNEDLEEYMQIGVENDKVVTIYASGPKVNLAPFTIGQSITDIFTQIPIEPFISFDYEGGKYQFELSENDINTNPLVAMDKYFVQLYIDKFDGALSSVRFVDVKTLLKLRPYELVYIGDLIEISPPSEGEESLISQRVALQIFDITNVMRMRHNREPLKMDEILSEVALAHSIDMFESNDFSHVSKTFGELSDRLEARNVLYQLAGENIAANYMDAPAVVEGWLNSKGHRETLLHKDFSHIGIGVYKKYYTQNFIQQ